MTITRRARRGALGGIVLALAVSAVPAARATGLPATGATPTTTQRTTRIGPLVVRRPVDRDALPSGCRQRRYAYLPQGVFLIADMGGGDKLSEVDAVRALRAGGFTWDEMPTALATMGAESDRCPRAVHNNLSATGQVLSVDYGLWQVNTRWHPQYTLEQLNDPVESSRIAKRLKDAGGWTVWHGYAARHTYDGWAAWAIQLAKDAGVK